jgi:NitT/TauT family transport system substrate-binding protein
MYAKGKSSKIVNVMQDKCTFCLIGRPEIKDVKSLKGKMIGCTKIGAETYAVGRFLAANAGLDPEKDVTMVSVGGMASMASAIDKNLVQATMAWQPLTTKLVNEKKAVLLARLNTKKDSIKHFGSPYYSFSVIQTTDDYIKEHPDIVQKFVNAMVESEKWIAGHSSDEVAKIVSPYFPGMKMDVVKSSIDQDREAFSRNGISTRQGHDTAIKVFMNAKILKKPVPFDAIVNNSFSEKAN